jgi:PKD repeat protein
LTITDDDGGTHSDQTTATIENVAPTADAGGPYSGFEGAILKFTGSASDPGADTFIYEWDFDDSDGITYSDATVSNPSKKWNDDYTGLIYLKVTDDDGGVGYDNVTITINNVEPVAYSGGPYTGYEGSTITFYGSATDQGADIFTFEWDFDDNGLYNDAMGPSTSWSWDDNGIYTVGLRVTDDDGDMNTATSYVTIENLAPTADANGPYSGNESTQITFTGEGTDPGSDTLTYLWDFGDGKISTLQNPEHTYDDNGYYTVTFTVRDDDGGFDIEETMAIISNQPPKIEPINKYVHGKEGQAIYIKINASDSKGDEITFSDSTDLFEIDPTSGVIQFTPTNDDVGIRDVFIFVTDDIGGTSTLYLQIEITNENQPPTLQQIGPQIVNEEQQFTLTVHARDEDKGDILHFSDNTELFDIDQNTGGISFTPTDEQVGTYSVTITVMDAEGASDHENVTFTVLNINDGPNLNSIPDQQGKVGQRFTYTVIAGDVDDEVLIFSDDSHLFVIDPTTGEISFIPQKGDAGVHTIHITVYDSHGANSTKTMVLEIEDTKTTPEPEPKKAAESETDWMSLSLLILLIIFIALLLVHMLMTRKAKQDDEIGVLEEDKVPGEELEEVKFDEEENSQPISTPPPFPPPPPPPIAPLIITDDEEGISGKGQGIEPSKIPIEASEDKMQKPATKTTLKKRKVAKRKMLKPKTSEGQKNIASEDKEKM